MAKWIKCKEIPHHFRHKYVGYVFNLLRIKYISPRKLKEFVNTSYSFEKHRSFKQLVQMKIISWVGIYILVFYKDFYYNCILIWTFLVGSSSLVDYRLQTWQLYGHFKCRSEVCFKLISAIRILHQCIWEALRITYRINGFLDYTYELSGLIYLFTFPTVCALFIYNIKRRRCLVNVRKKLR